MNTRSLLLIKGLVQVFVMLADIALFSLDPSLHILVASYLVVQIALASVADQEEEFVSWSYLVIGLVLSSTIPLYKDKLVQVSLLLVAGLDFLASMKYYITQ